MAMAIAAAVRVILVSQAFGTPSVKLDDSGEKDWSFGQLLTMLLLVLPFISALEIYRGEILLLRRERVRISKLTSLPGEMQVSHVPIAAAAAYSDMDQIPLTTTDTSNMKAYQANTPYR